MKYKTDGVLCDSELTIWHVIAYSGTELIHEQHQLFAELGAYADEIELARCRAGVLEQLLQQRVLAVLDQKLQGGMQGIIVLVNELSLWNSNKHSTHT